jgi:hypothetical protein
VQVDDPKNTNGATGEDPPPRREPRVGDYFTVMYASEVIPSSTKMSLY